MQLKVEKERYRVIILMDNMKITGYMYLTPRSRLTDVLNSNQMKEFIPVTDADIEFYENKQKIYVELIEINKNKINAIYPE